MSDLSTSYLGMQLRTPLLASSSPLTGNLDDLRRLEDAGAAGAVLPSLFEEQLAFEAMELDRLLETGSGSFGEALNYFPEFESYNTGPDHYLELITRAKSQLSMPIFASLNGTSPGGWLEHARLIEQAGADALELNLYSVAADPELTAALLEAREVELVRQVRAAVRIPIAVKLSPYFTALASTARALVAAGADGLVLFNRFQQTDLDLDTLEVRPRLALSTSEELRLPLCWIGILRGQLRASLGATSGIRAPADVVKSLLVGADATLIASALLEYGPDQISRLERGLLAWMEEREYASVEQLKGSASQRAIADPTAYERANYMKSLKSYSSSFRG